MGETQLQSPPLHQLVQLPLVAEASPHWPPPPVLVKSLHDEPW
jgi:hypothetical protein